TVTPVSCAGRIHSVRHTVGIEHEHLTRLNRGVVLVVTRVAKHSQRYSAALLKMRFSLRIHKQWRIVAGIGVSKRPISRVKNSVEGRNKLVSFDRFPK